MPPWCEDCRRIYWRVDEVNIYIYIYMHTYVYVYIYIYIYTDRHFKVFTHTHTRTNGRTNARTDAHNTHARTNMSSTNHSQVKRSLSYTHTHILLVVKVTMNNHFIWLSGVKYRPITRSTLVQVMACCLTAPPIHYLKPCWLIIRDVLWHLSEGNAIGTSQDICPSYEF